MIQGGLSHLSVFAIMNKKRGNFRYRKAGVRRGRESAQKSHAAAGKIPAFTWLLRKKARRAVLYRGFLPLRIRTLGLPAAAPFFLAQLLLQLVDARLQAAQLVYGGVGDMHLVHIGVRNRRAGDADRPGGDADGGVRAGAAGRDDRFPRDTS